MRHNFDCSQSQSQGNAISRLSLTLGHFFGGGGGNTPTSVPQTPTSTNNCSINNGAVGSPIETHTR